MKRKTRPDWRGSSDFAQEDLAKEFTMPAKKKEFSGKDVADAIQNAMNVLRVPREKLEIEVVDAGSTGIFGLIRKKARIRVLVRQPEKDRLEAVTESRELESAMAAEVSTVVAVTAEPAIEFPAKVVATRSVANSQPTIESGENEGSDDESEDAPATGATADEGDASPESLELIRSDLQRLVELVGFAATVTVTAVGLSVECMVTGEGEADLIGPEGKTLDSLQYIIRKIAAKRCPERLRISINIGEFRERRLEELKVLAVDLAAQVKTDGKTQVIPALNPSERREIHLVLQEDKEVRSRSVGDGLFKKILIYKPGKGIRGGGKRKPGARGKKGPATKADKVDSGE